IESWSKYKDSFLHFCKFARRMSKYRHWTLTIKNASSCVRKGQRCPLGDVVRFPSPAGKDNYITHLKFSIQRQPRFDCKLIQDTPDRPRISVSLSYRTRWLRPPRIN